MSDYSTITAAIIKQAKIREDSLPIRNEACRSKFFFHPQPTPKVCLLFHGFTAGPYQFEPLGKALFEAGYNVLAPLSPGHGIAGDWNGDNPPPLPTDAVVYQQFALDWLDIAKLLGENIIVGGYSSNGTLAAWLALERRQEIEKTLLFAPYISSSLKITDWLVSILPFYYEWLNKDNPGNFGYDGFLMPALRLFLDMGKEVLDRVQNERATPILVVSSEADRAIDRQEERDLFEAVLQRQPDSWYYCFDKSLNIPHTMMTELEGNDYLDILIALVIAYIENDVPWLLVKEIAYLMLQRKSFDAILHELNIKQQVSPSLRLMMRMIDKRSIVEDNTF